MFARKLRLRRKKLDQILLNLVDFRGILPRKKVPASHMEGNNKCLKKFLAKTSLGFCLLRNKFMTKN